MIPRRIVNFATKLPADGKVVEFEGARCIHYPATKRTVEQVKIWFGNSVYRSRFVAGKWQPTEQISS